MITPLFTALSRCATARAHLAGAEVGYLPHPANLRRYWRELATAATLSGHRWLDAERLGNES